MSSAQPSRSILIISYDFPPRAVRGAVRAAHFARFFAMNDWAVHVVCCAPDGTVRRDEVWAAELEQAGVLTTRTRALKRVEVLADGSIKTVAPQLLSLQQWFKQWNFQPDVYTTWRKEARPCIEQIVKEHSINIILGVAPPFSDLTLAQEIAESYEIPFAVDYGDVWQNNAHTIYPTPMHAKRSARMEQDLLRKAALILTTTRRSKEALLRRFRFLNHEEIMIVPHGFEEDEYAALKNEQFEEVLKDNALHITAYQDFHLGTSPKPMLKALRTLFHQKPELRSVIQISIIGIVRESHRALLRKWKLNDVVGIYPLTDRKHALHLVSQSDALWYSASDDSPADSPVIGDYLGARKALLLTCPPGQVLSSARDYAPVFHSEPKNVKRIVAQLEALHAAWLSRHLEPTAAQLAKTHSLNYSTNLREVSRLLGMNMKL